MSNSITLAQVQARLASLLEADANNLRSVTIGGRTVTYASAQDMQSAIDYWTAWETRLLRRASGQRSGHAVADFRSKR